MTKNDIPKEFATTVIFYFADILTEMSVYVYNCTDGSERFLNHIVGREAVDLYLMLYHHLEKKAVEAKFAPPRAPIPEAYMYEEEGVIHVAYGDSNGMLTRCMLDNPEGKELYSKLTGCSASSTPSYDDLHQMDWFDIA